LTRIIALHGEGLTSFSLDFFYYALGGFHSDIQNSYFDSRTRQGLAHRRAQDASATGDDGHRILQIKKLG